MSDLHAIPEFGNDFVKKFGVPDLIINNAGYGAFRMEGFSKSRHRKTNKYLFTAPFFMQVLCTYYGGSWFGTIVNITSLATLFPLLICSYNAGKSALSFVTQSMELESRKVKWIDFRLGDVRTNFNK